MRVTVQNPPQRVKALAQSSGNLGQRIEARQIVHVCGLPPLCRPSLTGMVMKCKAAFVTSPFPETTGHDPIAAHITVMKSSTYLGSGFKNVRAQPIQAAKRKRCPAYQKIVCLSISHPWHLFPNQIIDRAILDR
jgi:hypothetical protein